MRAQAIERRLIRLRMRLAVLGLIGADNHGEEADQAGAFEHVLDLVRQRARGDRDRNRRRDRRSNEIGGARKQHLAGAASDSYRCPFRAISSDTRWSSIAMP